MSRPAPIIRVSKTADILAANLALYAAGCRVGGWPDVAALNRQISRPEDQAHWDAKRFVKVVDSGQILYDTKPASNTTLCNGIGHMIRYLKAKS